MTNLLYRVFERFEQERIQYALLRDFDRVEAAGDGGDLDLLVREADLPRLEVVLKAYSFVSLPNWGYAPHHFFIAYNPHNGSWVKLDVVTQISFGYSVPSIHTRLADASLERRVKTGPFYRPSTEDELIILLLHCVLDKRQFKQERQARLSVLCGQVKDEAYLSTLMRTNGLPDMQWPELASLISTGNWPALLQKRKSITARLLGNRKLFAEMEQFSKRALRALNRRITGGRPPSLMVALLAPDGAGKSALSTGVRASFYFPVENIYMGLYPKQEGSPRGSQIPGVTFLTRLARQEGRYLLGWYHRTRRRLVIFDRYPYDALYSNHRQGWTARFRRWLLAHACPDPDLVFVLDAPAEVLYSRKKEHDIHFLEDQRQFYLTLGDRLPQTRVIDTTQNIEVVRRQVIQHIWQGIANRQGGIAPHAPINQPEAI